MARIGGWLDARRAGNSIRSAMLSALVVLIAAPVLGFVLAVVSHAVPDARIRAALETSIARDQLNAADYGQAVSGKQIDYFTDCIGITIGLPDEGAASPVRSAVATPTGGGCSAAVPALAARAAGDEVAYGYDYYRYWHGYTAFTRPTLAAVGLGGARVLALVALFLSALGFGRSLAREHGWVVATLVLGPLVVTTDFAELPRSLPHAAGATAALAVAWYAHRTVVRRPTLGEIGWVAAVAGVTFLYFDILTMPPGAAMMLVGAVGLGYSRVASGARLGVGMFVALVIWSFAWAWMWVAKWAIAATVFGVSTVVDVVRFTAENRVDGGADRFDFTFLNTSRTMVVAWANQPLAVPVMIAASIGTAAIFITRWRRNGSVDRPLDRVLLALPAGVAFVWYEIMRNHSQNHSFFTYRSLAISAGLVLAAAVVTLPELSPAEATTDA